MLARCRGAVGSMPDFGTSAHHLSLKSLDQCGDVRRNRSRKRVILISQGLSDAAVSPTYLSLAGFALPGGAQATIRRRIQ